jgi:hypothetical protein
MKIVKKTVQVVVIQSASSYPQVNGIYYLANPGNGYDSFFSKDGGDSYPRIIFNYTQYDQVGYDYIQIVINPGNVSYVGAVDYPEGWPGFDSFNNTSWNDEIESYTDIADRAYIYKRGSTVYVSYNMNATVLGDIIP